MVPLNLNQIFLRILFRLSTSGPQGCSVSKAPGLPLWNSSQMTDFIFHYTTFPCPCQRRQHTGPGFAHLPFHGLIGFRPRHTAESPGRCCPSGGTFIIQNGGEAFLCPFPFPRLSRHPPCPTICPSSLFNSAKGRTRQNTAPPLSECASLFPHVERAQSGIAGGRA